MVALDFPDAPTVGQVYDKWTWNGTQWVLSSVAAVNGTVRRLATGSTTAYVQTVAANETAIIVSATADVVTGRRYRCMVYLAMVTPTVAPDTYKFRIYIGATLALNSSWTAPVATGAWPLTLWTEWQATSTGSMVFGVRAQRNSGTGVMAAGGNPGDPAYITVDDVGTGAIT